MAVNPNEDTEFNDALRKHGILPPREPTPPTPSPPASPTLSERLEDLTPSELQERLEDEDDDETARLIEKIRKQRIAEMQREMRRARFGRVYPIGRDDYTREVTEASKVDEPGEQSIGTGVVCFLYKDGIPHSDRAKEHVNALAAKHPRTKFVSIVGDKCIPNLPDSRLPMFIIYRKGDIRNQLISWGADRERRVEELEALLILSGAVIPPDRPLPGTSRRKDDDSSEEEDDENDKAYKMRSKSTMTNVKSSKNIRSQAKDDEDSDFDI